jgi:SRSO17 transposase
VPSRGDPLGIPPASTFATKPALAKAMISRVLDAGTPAGWTVGDEVYSRARDCTELTRRGLGYVLAVAKNHLVATRIGPLPAIELARWLSARAQ